MFTKTCIAKIEVVTLKTMMTNDEVGGRGAGNQLKAEIATNTNEGNSRISAR